MTALAALIERMIVGQLRDDLPFAVLAPAGIFVVFNIAMRNVIDTGPMNYSQYLLPVVIIQFVLLGALTTADFAARDEQSGLGARLRTLPISPLLPLTARMAYCLFRGAVAALVAVAAGYAFGFRMGGGFLYSVAFVIIVLLFTLALSLGADATGTGIAGSAIGRNGTSSQLLLIPQLLLIMLSTGMAPVDSFPEWLHSFVRHQPVSQVTETLRGFTTGDVVVSNLVASLAWCIGLLMLFGAFAIKIQRRTR